MEDSKEELMAEILELREKALVIQVVLEGKMMLLERAYKEESNDN